MSSRARQRAQKRAREARDEKTLSWTKIGALAGLAAAGIGAVASLTTLVVDDPVPSTDAGDVVVTATDLGPTSDDPPVGSFWLPLGGAKPPSSDHGLCDSATIADLEEARAQPIGDHLRLAVTNDGDRRMALTGVRMIDHTRSTADDAIEFLCPDAGLEELQVIGLDLAQPEAPAVRYRNGEAEELLADLEPGETDFFDLWIAPGPPGRHEWGLEVSVLLGGAPATIEVTAPDGGRFTTFSPSVSTYSLEPSGEDSGWLTRQPDRGSTEVGVMPTSPDDADDLYGWCSTEWTATSPCPGPP